MLYLLLRNFIDVNYRGWIIWGIFVFTIGASVYLVWAPHLKSRVSILLSRLLGASVLALLFAIVFPILILSDIMGHADNKVTSYKSQSGSRVALASHTSFRDFSRTVVTVHDEAWFSRSVAYYYEGDGDDYFSAADVEWRSDQSLVIRYTEDTTGEQVCHPRVGDIAVTCIVRPTPTFEHPDR